MPLDESFLNENPDYLQLLKRIVQYEDENPKPDSNHVEDTSHNTYWDYADVSGHPSKLYKLETEGILDRVFDSNSATYYSLHDRSGVRDVVESFSEKYSGDRKVVMHDFPSEEELENKGVFDDVVGYEEIKWLIRRAISSDNIVNIVLVGPPGCGKTVFLRSIQQLEGASFVSGSKTSGPGFTDKMFDEEPSIMAIDELDDMNGRHQKDLSDYTEEGILSETKGNDKVRKMETNTKTLATANSLEDVIGQIEDRFTDLHLSKYSLEEFKEVCVNILPDEHKVGDESAIEIAEAVWDIEGYGNVRKAEDVAALSKGEDPEKVIEVLEQHSPGGMESLF